MAESRHCSGLCGGQMAILAALSAATPPSRTAFPTITVFTAFTWVLRRSEHSRHQQGRIAHPHAALELLIAAAGSHE